MQTEGQKEAKRRWREKNKAYYADRRQTQGNKDYMASYHKERNATDSGKEKQRERAARMREKHPDRTRARQLLRNAIRRGEIKRQPCQHCGNEKSEAHHEDYSKPLEVIWACQPCHMEHHHRERVAQDAPC